MSSDMPRKDLVRSSTTDLALRSEGLASKGLELLRKAPDDQGRGVPEWTKNRVFATWTRLSANGVPTFGPDLRSMCEYILARPTAPNDPGAHAGFRLIKRLLPEFAGDGGVAISFLTEARVAAAMNHPNILQTFGHGKEGGTYFMAVENTEGRTLRQGIDIAIRRRERIPIEICRSVVEGVCNGASYAHNRADPTTGNSLNIVIRDLSLENVLLSQKGEVKIIDFAIAKSALSSGVIEAGRIKGQFAYMSPEQSMAKKLDKRSDIFTIGVLLYEILTGVSPFHKNSVVQTLEAVQRYDPPSVTEYLPALAPFAPIIAKALRKDRDQRYGDAAEMRDALRRIVLPPATENLGQWMARQFPVHALPQRR